MPTLIANSPAYTALAFRGYNVTNVGRTAELMQVPAYESLVKDELQRFARICEAIIGRSVDLVKEVLTGYEGGLAGYPDAIALIVAMQVAQLRILKEVHGIDIDKFGLSFGYSLGELTAVSHAGYITAEDMIRIPLTMAQDAMELASDVTMGVLFSRGPNISQAQVEQLCEKITSEGQGTIGVSSVLSPNTFLLLGQRDTIERFRLLMKDTLPARVQIRANTHKWPPLHTPICRQRAIPDRASVMMDTLAFNLEPKKPKVLSLVTGKPSYSEISPRVLLRQWIDQPQRLWDAIDYCLAVGIDTVIHVGPEPNLIPATFARLSENVREQTSDNSFSSLSLRAVSGIVRNSWLASMLPARTNLLRAPYIHHVILEDWLLEHAP